MQDVIFNGAASRRRGRPRSVELAFDNSDSRIGGEMGAASGRRCPVKRFVTKSAKGRLSGYC